MKAASPLPLFALGLGVFAALTVFKTAYDREKKRRVEASPLYDLGLDEPAD
jgi:hypothetical protein